MSILTPYRRSASSPLVTIGMPTFQKERHLRETLEAALAQDHDNLEILLVDNHSTDATPEICAEFVARDARVRFHRNRRNIGSRRNFNLAFELSQGEYFVWSRGHDVWDPRFISRGVALLEADPDAVLYHCRCHEFDDAGEDLGPVDETLDTRGLDLPTRVSMTWRSVLGPATLGVIRSAAMDRTRLYDDIAGCDILFLVELAAQGAFAFDDEHMLSLRKFRDEASEAETLRRAWTQLNPFRTADSAPIDHAIDFTQRHARILAELPVDAATRDELLSDLIAAYRKKYAGSFTRALDAIAERVHAASDATEVAADEESAQAIDYVRASQWLDRLQFGLLFQPEHDRAQSAREMLLGLALDLTAHPASRPDPIGAQA